MLHTQGDKWLIADISEFLKVRKVNIGESQKENDLFFVCSFIEYLSRKTKNQKKIVVKKLGRENIKKIYDLAKVYHSENIEKISDEWIEKVNLTLGTYDPVSECKYQAPTYWDIGRVYQRLILMVNHEEEKYIDTLIEVLSSWIIEKIDNYNSSMYYENPSYLYACYEEGKVL